MEHGASLSNTYIYHGTIGSGGAGTSYSGGSASAAFVPGYSYEAGGSSANGGANGGAGSSFTGSYRESYYYCGGGAGNPGGNGIRGLNGSNGTGGLLIMYANNIINNKTISANGTTGGKAYNGGGSSGGGSINIFYNNEYSNNGTVVANGGTAAGTNKGGAGGKGTVSIGNISTGTYVSN